MKGPRIVAEDHSRKDLGNWDKVSDKRALNTVAEACYRLVLDTLVGCRNMRVLGTVFEDIGLGRG